MVNRLPLHELVLVVGERAAVCLYSDTLDSPEDAVICGTNGALIFQIGSALNRNGPDLVP